MAAPEHPAQGPDERPRAAPPPAEAGGVPRLEAPPALGRHAILAAALVLTAVVVGAAGWWWAGGVRGPKVPVTQAMSLGKAALDRRDYNAARHWYRRAANAGDATAQATLGNLYEKGRGVPQNYGEAMRWYRQAAEQGDIDAEYRLALLYADGHGVPADAAEARSWMQKAATAGYPEAKKWIEAHGG